MELWDSDIPLCEKCGYARDLTKAHILNASQGGSGSDPANILNLCGSHGIGGRDGRGGCHDKSDNTAAGRTWKVAQGEKLAEYYRAGEGRKHWKY